MKIVTSIAHASHIPERVSSLTRMAHAFVGETHVETHRGPPHEWSLKQWQWAADQGATHAVFLNDDLIPCKDFPGTVKRVIEARPNCVINGYNCHPHAHEAVKRGWSWLTSVDGLIGNCYILPTGWLRTFLAWRAHALKPGTVELLSEDQLLNLFCMRYEQMVWHTVPALVDHDVTVASAYGNTQMRRPTVYDADKPRVADWNTDAVHVGRVFHGNHGRLVDGTVVDDEPKKRIELYYQYCGDGNR